MALELDPPYEWIEILQIEDEVEQGRAATKYVCELNQEIWELNSKLCKIKNELDEIKRSKKYRDISTAWDHPSWYNDEQVRCFYGDFS